MALPCAWAARVRGTGVARVDLKWLLHLMTHEHTTKHTHAAFSIKHHHTIMRTRMTSRGYVTSVAAAPTAQQYGKGARTDY